MEDLTTLLAEMQKQITERTNFLLERLLSGGILCSGSCLQTATHIAFGPETFEAQPGYLRNKYAIVQEIRFYCDEHWTYGEETVAYVKAL